MQFLYEHRNRNLNKTNRNLNFNRHTNKKYFQKSRSKVKCFTEYIISY